MCGDKQTVSTNCKIAIRICCTRETLFTAKCHISENYYRGSTHNQPPQFQSNINVKTFFSLLLSHISKFHICVYVVITKWAFLSSLHGHCKLPAREDGKSQCISSLYHRFNASKTLLDDLRKPVFACWSLLG